MGKTNRINFRKIKRRKLIEYSGLLNIGSNIKIGSDCVNVVTVVEKNISLECNL